MLAYLLKSSAFSFFQLVLETSSSWEQTLTLTKSGKSSSTEMAWVTLLQQHQPKEDLAFPKDAQQQVMSTASLPPCSLHFLPNPGALPPSTKTTPDSQWKTILHCLLLSDILRNLWIYYYKEVFTLFQKTSTALQIYNLSLTFDRVG